MIRFTSEAHDDTDSPGQPATLVVGGGRPGLGIAVALARDGRPVTFVGEGAPDGLADGVRVLSRRVPDADSLRSVLDEVGEVAAVIAAGPDSEALLVAHLARLELDDVAIVALVDDPWREGAFDGIDAEPLSTSAVLADAIRDRLRRVATA